MQNPPIVVPTQILEALFASFTHFIESVASEQFQTFAASDYLNGQEGYKRTIYNEAKRRLGVSDWQTEDIGTGRIQARVGSALLNGGENNLINWRKIDEFRNLAVNPELEQLFFDFYKNRVPDSVVFERLSHELSYQLIAYLFFIKNDTQYLPISQRIFDEIIAERLEIEDFTTAGQMSWENYKTFIDIIKQVHRFLRTKDNNATLLDAHSFLWVLGKQMRDWQESTAAAPPTLTTDVEEEISDNPSSDSTDTHETEIGAISNEADEADDVEERRILQRDIPETEKMQLIKARRGQGKFRSAVSLIETGCRLTGVTDKSFLIASHIKPWRDCEDFEKLDGNNGLLLSPHGDSLFDSGSISFNDEGQILWKNEQVLTIMEAWGLDASKNVGSFSETQRKYLAYHRSKFGFGTVGS